MRALTLILAFCLTIFAADLKPKKVVKLDSPALDLVVNGGRLFASTANGEALEIAAKPKKLYALPHFVTPTGEKRAQKAFSLALSPSANTIVVAAEDGKLYAGKNGVLSKSAFESKAVVKKLAMLDENLVLIGLVNSQLALFDISKNKALYTVQIGSSPLSDIALSPDKKSVAVVGEAGFVYIIDVLNGKQKALYKNVNLDNIYKADYQSSLIATAGQDRRISVLSDKGAIKAKFEAEFLVYAVALSPSARVVAAAINDQNDIALFDTATKSAIAVGKGHNATLNRIVFINETEFASCADENKILIWSVKR